MEFQENFKLVIIINNYFMKNFNSSFTINKFANFSISA